MVISSAYTGLSKFKIKSSVVAAGRIFGVAGLLVTVGMPAVAQAATTNVVVTPANHQGWISANYDDSTSSYVTGPTAGGTDNSFVTGPGTPPLGTGSLRQKVGADGGDAAIYGNNAYNGKKLSNVTALSYSTYVTTNNGAQATSLVLRIDRDGNGTKDDRLFFEPVYQTGTYGQLPYSSAAIPNQCGVNPNCVTTGVWQNWNALTGGWWSEQDSGSSGPPLTTIAAYAAQYPNAKIATDTGTQGLRIQSGGGAGAWDNFDGNIDALTVGLNSNSTVYNFELTNVPTDKSQCKNNGYLDYTNASGQPFTSQNDCVNFVNGNSSGGSSGSTHNTNNVKVTNNSNQKASTGNASSNHNTTGGNATSGNASNSNTTTTTIKIKN